VWILKKIILHKKQGSELWEIAILSSDERWRVVLACGPTTPSVSTPDVSFISSLITVHINPQPYDRHMRLIAQMVGISPTPNSRPNGALLISGLFPKQKKRKNRIRVSIFWTNEILIDGWTVYLIFQFLKWKVSLVWYTMQTNGIY